MIWLSMIKPSLYYLKLLSYYPLIGKNCISKKRMQTSVRAWVVARVQFTHWKACIYNILHVQNDIYCMRKQTNRTLNT